MFYNIGPSLQENKLICQVLIIPQREFARWQIL